MKQRAVLLQTDIVDSTLLAERLGDAAMASFRIEHDRVARDLLHPWHGHELERSDGFLMRFDTAGDAVEYAIAYHRAVAALPVPIKVRAGLHLGTLHLRHNSDAHVALGARSVEADGLLIPTTVRVMSLALGGQTLMTPDVRAAVGSVGRRIVSHGHWRLKGLGEPIELFEIGDTDAPFHPPPDSAKAYRVVQHNDGWLPRGDVSTTLPAERNAFVGRQSHLGEVARHFEAGARLVSIVGAGGAGKTRLAQHFGWAHLGDFGGGVWFCDLSQTTTFDGLCGAVAQGLGIPLAQADPVEQIADAIAGRDDCLVILDNCEQIVPHVVEALGRWLDRAARARFLVTTRSVLGIDGEDVIALPPMDRDEGAELFVARARAARNTFAVAGDGRRLLDETVALLDGLPLAIELAAARVRVMSLDTLHARMQDRFAILASSGGRPTRHATLRATFDWSWDLLVPAERAALAQLAIFEGGFTLEAAEAVLAASPHDPSPPVFEVLQSLVEKSWVQRPDERRFTLLRSVQEYAAERLTGDAAVSRRHWTFFGSLDENAAMADRCIEIDNLVAATRRAAERGDARGATAALRNCWAALKLCGPFRKAVELGVTVRALQDLTPGDRGWIEYVIGSGLRYGGQAIEAAHSYEAGLTAAREAGAPRVEARLLAALAEQATVAGRYAEAEGRLDEARKIGEGIVDPAAHCIVLNALGTLERSRGRAEAAIGPYQDAIAIAREAGDRHWEGGLVGNLGLALHTLGRLDEAQVHYERALQLAQSSGDQRWEGNTRCNFGLLLQERGEHGRSRQELETALSKARELGFVRLEFVVSSNLGLLAGSVDAFDEAEDHFRHARDLARRLGDRRAEGETSGHHAALLARRGDRSGARRLFEEGEALLVAAGDAAGLGVLLAAHAWMVCDAGDRIGAAALRDRIKRIMQEQPGDAESSLAAIVSSLDALLGSEPCASD